MKLPLNCDVEYIDDFLRHEEANDLYSLLLKKYKIDNEQIIIEAGGERIATDSFKILFATQALIDRDSHPENIHGKSFVWSGLMAELRDRVEKFTGKTFELAMCLFYPDGNYFAPFHYDQDTSGVETVIPSLSLGEVRKFGFKGRESDDFYNLDLAHGSLLLMKDYSQLHYEHSLFKDPQYKNGRINITFREPKFM